MTNERAIQILENLISIDGDVIIEGEYTEALEMAIRSLQKEQPEVMVEKVCGTCTYWQEGTLDRGQCQAGEPCKTHSADTCDRWEQNDEIPIKEQPYEDLEEEIKRYEASLPESATVDPFEGHPTLEDVARHFANWQKEQMLKDAVERTVKIDSGGYPYIDITAELYDYGHNVPLAKEGELVKIIIVKEEEK